MNEQPLPPFLNGVKVSDTFMQYVEPFLNQLILDKAKHGLFDIKIESLDKVLRLPWCIWNAIAAESMSTREIDFLAWIDLILKDMPPSIKNLVASLKERKRTKFDQFKYYLGPYRLYYNKNNELMINVEARARPLKVPNSSIGECLVN